MEKNKLHIDWIQLAVKEPEKMMQWLCDNLWFEQCKKEKHGVVNGNCRFWLEKDVSDARLKKADICFGDYGHYEHIALETPDINAALRYCKSRGFCLETRNGEAFYNPKVWKTGMNYFNILTPFGIKLEVAQRLDREYIPSEEKLIIGLEHAGIEVSNIENSVSLYLEKGFQPGYPMVVNETDSGNVKCEMLLLDDVMIELYEFTDKIEYHRNFNSGILGFIFR